MQWVGGIDDLERKFSNFRQKNQNSTMADTKGIMGQQTGFCATNFTRNLKRNDNGDKNAYVKEFWEEKKHEKF